MRSLALLAAVAACSAPERAQPLTRLETPTPLPAVAQLPLAPGLRLPDGVTPLHYDLTLEIDPDRETFAGEVRVRVRLDRATDHIWIHADELDIKSARYDDGPLTTLPVRGDQMIAFGFGKQLSPREVELHFTYTGRTTGDQEGLFRQQRGDRWYLFSQGEAVFARRITPCFDEPRFKTPWRVTLVVPKEHVALANTSEDTTVVDGDRKRITFAESAVMASYLLTIAVGPFDLVDAGTVGKNKIPVRVAVRAGAGKQVGVVASALPAIVDALEDYIGEPLPVSKLDLVGVPEFFGAMENPGLVTFAENMLVGRDSKERIAYFTHTAAHELAHQWFGNSVTPAWWDDLWLSESFASWLGDKVTAKLGRFGDRALRDVLDRRDALEADSGSRALPLHRPIAGNADPDESFDAIAYHKGEAVLATFEALGKDAFRTMVREYLRAHRNANATKDDLVTALARATKPEVGIAFDQYATLVGAPVVDLALRCDGKPTLVASARDQRHVPACVRYAGGKSPVCALVGAKTELALGATCPAWVDGNAFAGYYNVHWQGRSPTQNLAHLDPTARVIAGDDLAASLRRGELSATDAVAELRALLAGKDEYAHFGAVALARELDELVDDATRPAWSAWLAARVPKLERKRDKRESAANALRELLAPGQLPAAELARVRTFVDKLIDNDEVPDPPLAEVFTGKEAEALFDRVVDKARSTGDADQRERWLRLLGGFTPALAERTAALVTDKAELPVEPIWEALEEYFERPAARAAAWRALQKHLDPFMKRATHRAHDVLDATALLCDRDSRDEVAAALAPYLRVIPGGRARLDRTLATIDQCVARRARIGNLAHAIAAAR